LQAAEQANPFADFGNAPVSSNTAVARKPAYSRARERERAQRDVHPIHLEPVHPQERATERRSATPQYVPPPIYIPGVTTPTDAYSSSAASRGARAIPPDQRITYPHSEPAAERRARAAERAAQIRTNQANAPEVLEGTSHPPVENYDTESNGDAQMHATQFNPSQGRCRRRRLQRAQRRAQAEPAARLSTGRRPARARTIRRVRPADRQ
jgi:hypothetical protein